jgi:thiol-disulfide isomerase/thioredoxin
VKNEDAALTLIAAGLKNSEDSILHFTFKDLDGHEVSLDNERFRNKVIVLQIMGSWCPNCMDETEYLAGFYKKNKVRGIEVISLAYELSTNESRSVASLRKFRDRFGVTYTMLNTGATAGDPDRTTKTLPSLQALKAFPTTILLDRDHRVKEIASGFYGPGAGEYFTKYKSHFEDMINTQLAQ